MPNKSETSANVEDVGQPTSEAQLAAPDGYAARTHEDNVRVELYNAAVAYAQYVMSDDHDYDSAMKVAQRLEDAADAFANR